MEPGRFWNARVTADPVASAPKTRRAVLELLGFASVDTDRV